MTKLCFLALPMPQFTTLQRRVFPVYFNMQTVLVVLVAATHPPSSLSSLVGGKRRLSDALPLLCTLLPAILNNLVYGPRCIQTMIARAHQGLFRPLRSEIIVQLELRILETRDGRKFNDKENMSVEMQKCNRAFSKAHAMSIHLNLIAIISTVWYGFSLASRLSVSA